MNSAEYYSLPLIPSKVVTDSNERPLGMRPQILKNSYCQLRSDFTKFRRTAGLIGSLPGFFRATITGNQAREQIRRLLDNRNEAFLGLIRHRVYANPTSPYLRLLKFVGCEFADLRSHVLREGLERTLEQLAAEGAYLTSDEYKGKKAVVRGSLSFEVSPGDFEISASMPGFLVESSGTTNRPVQTSTSLEWMALRSLATAVFSSAHNLFAYSQALYDAILPASSVTHLLMNAKLGAKTDRWFARVVPVNNRVDGWYHYLATYSIVRMGQCFGPGFPKPEFIESEETDRIVQWILQQNRLGKNCYIITVASSAARIARTAKEMGVSLKGTKFNVAGEPFTETKEGVIKQVDAVTTSRYSYGGGIPVGLGCAEPAYRDEVHVNQHLLAVISHPKPICNNATPPINPLLLTTLHPAAPRLLLNVQNGDYVTFEDRQCHCELQKVGLTRHLYNVRSYEKFTSEGMNYFYGDLFDFIERTLPSEFGGGPGDYQLIEEEDSGGQSRLTLVIHPSVGNLDERRVLVRLRNAFSKGSRDNRFMTGIWESAGTFRIKRAIPHSSNRGKVLPLHISMVSNRSGRG